MMGPMGGMMVMKAMGLCSFVATAILLAISFFVLVLVRKADELWLKVFGYVVAILLWISASIVFSTVLFTSSMCHRAKMPKDYGFMREGKMRKPMMNMDKPANAPAPVAAPAAEGQAQ